MCPGAFLRIGGVVVLSTRILQEVSCPPPPPRSGEFLRQNRGGGCCGMQIFYSVLFWFSLRTFTNADRNAEINQVRSTECGRHRK